MSRVGLVELWDADYGVSVVGGVLTSWRGRMGNVARPDSAGAGLALNTALLSGSRRCVLFNGAASGLRANIPSLRRAHGNLAVHVHAYVSLNDAAAQSLFRIHNDGGNTRLYLHHPTTINQVQVEGIDNTASINTTGWAVGEAVYSGGRFIGGNFRLWKNGSSLGTQAESTSALNVTSDVAIGFNGLSPGGGWFNGGIRRIAIYSSVHDDDAAAAIDLQWRGY